MSKEKEVVQGVASASESKPEAKEKKLAAKVTGGEDFLGSNSGGIEIEEVDVNPEEPEKKEENSAKEPVEKADAKKETEEEKTAREAKEKEEKEKSEKKPLILGRFKTNADVEKALSNLDTEYHKTIDELRSMEHELGVKLLIDSPFELGSVENDQERINEYRKLERAYTIATQKRAEARRRIADLDPEDELLKKKSDDELDKEFDELKENPKAFAIKVAREEFQRLLRKEQKRQEIAQKELIEENKRITGEINAFREENPEYDDFKPEIEEYIQKYIPPGANLPPQTILKLALDAVKGSKSKPDITDAIEKERKKQEDLDTADKRRASMASGSGAGGGGSRQNNSTPSEEQSIIDSIKNAGGGGGSFLD